jgi:hypothetical protein
VIPRKERRQHERFPQAFEVHARCLMSQSTPNDSPKEFDGRIQNLSAGGACILSQCPLTPAAFVFCNFPVSDVPVSVPAFMQVRWTVKSDQKSPNYITGFQFIA